MMRFLPLLAAAILMAAEPPPLVYVPYDQVPKTGDPAAVLLPYSEFRKLWEAAAAAQLRPNQPLVGAALSTYDLSGTVVGDRAELRLTATAVALATGWSSVPLPAGLAVGNLACADARVVLERGPQGLRLHLPAPATYQITATVAAPVARDHTGLRTLVLPLPAAGAGRLDLLLPEPGAELSTAPAVALSARPEGDGTRVQAVVGAQGDLRLTWRAPMTLATGTPLILAETRAELTVGSRSLATTAQVALTVLRRGVDTITLHLPPEVQVLSVEAPALRTWERQGDDLRLHLHELREGALAITVRLERLLPGTEATRQLALALPQVVGAERQTGILVLRADEGLSLAVTSQEGLSQVDPREVEAQGAAAAFRWLAPPPPLAVAATRLEPDLRAVLYQLTRLATDETRIDVAIELSVRRAGVFALAAELPEGWELVDAGGLDLDDTRVVGRRLELALRSRLLGDGRLNLRFRAPAALPRQGGAQACSVGMLQLAGARVARGSLAVAAPKSWAVQAEPAEGLAGADVRSVVNDPQLAEGLRALRDDEEVALAWTWLGHAPGVRLAAAPRSRELIAHHEELATIGEGGVRRVVTWRGEVRYSAAASLHIAMPQALAATAQIKAAGLAERVVTAGADGAAVIELRFPTPLIGSFTITCETSEPLPRLSAGTPVQLTLAPIMLSDVTRRTVVLAVAREGSLTVQARANGQETLAIADLPPTVQSAGTVAAFRSGDTSPLDLTIERHDLVELTDAALPSVRLRAVLGEDGRLRVAGTAQVVSRGRPHLELRLPEGAELLEVVIDGRSVRPSRRADGALVLPLPGDANDHEVGFAYEQPAGPQPPNRLDIDLPTLGGAAAGRRVPVERTSLHLWVPRHLALAAAGGDLRLDPQAQPPGRIAGLTVAIPEVGSRLDLVRLGDGGSVHLRLWSWKLMAALGLVAGLAVALLGWPLRRRPRLLVAHLGCSLAVAAVAVAAPPAWLPLATGLALGACAAALVAGLTVLIRKP